MPNGSLHSLLHSPSPPRPLSWARRVLVALRISRAVLSLHSADPHIIHRDIKPENVLFDRRSRAHLADFSLALHAGSSSTAPPAGTLGYMDPRYTASAEAGTANDVYSFGVLLLELFSSTRAMDEERDHVSVATWAVPLIREGRVADVCDRRLKLSRKMVGPVGRVLRIAARCVSAEAETRPRMGEVVAEMERVTECFWWKSWDCLQLKASAALRRWARARRRCRKKKVNNRSSAQEQAGPQRPTI